MRRDFLTFWHDIGGVPYPTLSNIELCRLLKTGYRMERPEMCSDEVWVTDLIYSSQVQKCEDIKLSILVTVLYTLDEATVFNYLNASVNSLK